MHVKIYEMTARS